MRILYTANLNGQLALLPRLYTFIKTLRGEFAPDYLIDLGGACAPDVWHCQVTGGRSMLIALDGMGYQVVNASALPPLSMAKLAEQVSFAMVSPLQAHQAEAVRFVTHAPQAAEPLHICLTPAPQTEIKAQVVYLQATIGAQVGIVQISADGGISAEIREMPPDTAPDPTIAGVVDFVEGEARYYQRKTGEA